MEYIDKIDSMGGVISGIEKGFFQKEIADSAYKYQREIENKERTIVGVNEYAVEKDWVPIKLLRIEQQAEKEQVDRLQKLKKKRNNKKAKQVLDKLHNATERDENLMSTIIEAVKAYATIGEICDVLRNIYGQYREQIII